MARTLRILLLLVVIAAPAAMAQVQYSVGNYTRYGLGTQKVFEKDQKKEYFENQTNVRLFWDDFTVGFQYLYDDPPEFGPKWQGMRKRYVEYAREGLELRAGDFFELYGKGLAMNLFENRGINYDTGLDGLRGTYRSDYFTAKMAAGTMRFYDLIKPTRIEYYSVKSAHGEVHPVEWMRIGGSIVSATGQLPATFGMDSLRADIPEGMITLKGLGFEAFASYARKNTTAFRPQSGGSMRSYERTGDGLYGSLSYSNPIGFGLTFEYKDYRFDPVDPLERSDINRPTRMLPMQNPPIVHKEHSFYLLSRNPHVVDFNDEKGMQLDVFYAATPQITINLNGAISSRQHSYKMGGNGRYVVTAADLSTLFSADPAFAPFFELYGDVEWYFEGQSYVRAGFNRRYDDPAAGEHVIHSTTVPIRVEYMLNEVYSLGLSLEQQFYHDNTYKKQDWYNQYVAITLGKAPELAATVRMEYSTVENDDSGRNFWLTGELAYRLKNAHTLTLSYGSERGGIVCSSGVCRTVLPFNGLRFSLLTQI